MGYVFDTTSAYMFQVSSFKFYYFYTIYGTDTTKYNIIYNDTGMKIQIKG